VCCARADLDPPFAVIDLETTGLFPARGDRVIEVAVVRVEPDGSITDRYVTLVNPDRDLGPTALHGISAQQLLGAPPFARVAGDVTCRLRGAVVVGHNVRFDLAFLAAELTRLGHPAPTPPALCTMALGSRLGLAENGRALTDLCMAVGVTNVHPHSAGDDAGSTAALLVCLLERARNSGLASLGELGLIPGDGSCWPQIAPSGVAHTRQHAEWAARAQPSYLATLVSRLPAVSVVSHRPDHAPYLDLLDRVLEDGILTEQEAEGLVTAARDVYQLGRPDVIALHEQYVLGLSAAALEDRVVTEGEREEIGRVIRLLGVSLTTEEALGRAAEGTPDVQAGESLRGKRVCFTGELRACVGGVPVIREMAESLATHAGLIVQGGVTKQLDMLVVADPHTMSGKAKKARQYGTRIITEQAFWRALGLAVS
jgi:DNA polymerase-3 subunit epsilon